MADANSLEEKVVTFQENLVVRAKETLVSSSQEIVVNDKVRKILNSFFLFMRCVWNTVVSNIFSLWENNIELLITI